MEMEDADSNDPTDTVNIHGHFHPSTQQTPVPGIPLQTAYEPGVWTTGFCDCCDDPCNAVTTYFCPCVTFGQIAEILDGGKTSCIVCGLLFFLLACVAPSCLLSCNYRSKLRANYGLPEAPAPDWILHCCCQGCALCQEYRELKNRGLDPSQGWSNNVAMKQKQQMAATNPPAKQAMTA